MASKKASAAFRAFIKKARKGRKPSPVNSAVSTPMTRPARKRRQKYGK